MKSKKSISSVVAQKYYIVQSALTKRETAFRERADFQKFEEIIQKSIGLIDHKDPRRFGCKIATADIVSYNILPNTFSILLRGHSASCNGKLMRRVMFFYTSFYNKKYKKTGPLFGDDFYTMPIRNQQQLKQATRFIHQMHTQFKKWPFSSYQDFLTSPRSWINPEPILETFESFNRYRRFIDNSQAMKQDSTGLLELMMQAKFRQKLRLAD